MTSHITSPDHCICNDNLSRIEQGYPLRFQKCPAYQPSTLLERCSYAIFIGDIETFNFCLEQLDDTLVNEEVLEIPMCIQDHVLLKQKTLLLLNAYKCGQKEMLFALLQHGGTDIHKTNSKERSLLIECVPNQIPLG